MLYRTVEALDVRLSAIGLGGHEFLQDGSSRGFNEDFKNAVKPGYASPGYGGDKRRALLKTAYEHGINFFDVTIDPEKEALGRNLREAPPPYPVYVQTRPEGMGYGYDPANRKMADYALLRAEVQRILNLMRLERVDFFNFPFLQEALDADPEYLAKTRHNIARLKKEGLIRFATADNFSGEATYLAQVGAGCFDALAMNFSFADDGARARALPAAAERGMAVVGREVFQKGRLFKMGEEADIADRDLLARLALKWNLAVDGLTLTLVGAEDGAQLENSLRAVAEPDFDEAEAEALAAVRATETYREFSTAKRQRFSPQT